MYFSPPVSNPSSKQKCNFDNTKENQQLITNKFILYKIKKKYNLQFGTAWKLGTDSFNVTLQCQQSGPKLKWSIFVVL